MTSQHNGITVEEIPSFEDAYEEDEGVPCMCRFCHCRTRTEYGGTCLECLGGCHQG